MPTPRSPFTGRRPRHCEGRFCGLGNRTTQQHHKKNNLKTGSRAGGGEAWSMRHGARGRSYGTREVWHRGALGKKLEPVNREASNREPEARNLDRRTTRGPCSLRCRTQTSYARSSRPAAGRTALQAAEQEAASAPEKRTPGAGQAAVHLSSAPPPLPRSVLLICLLWARGARWPRLLSEHRP